MLVSCFSFRRVILTKLLFLLGSFVSLVANSSEPWAFSKDDDNSCFRV